MTYTIPSMRHSPANTLLQKGINYHKPDYKLAQGSVISILDGHLIKSHLRIGSLHVFSLLLQK